MKKDYLIIIIFLSLTSQILPQGPGEPFNPETANGAKYIHSTGHRLLWQNPDSTIYNIIYFSEDSSLVTQLDSSVILYDGTPSTVYDTVYLTTVEPLDWSKKYYWRVVEYYNSGSIVGPVWHFKTMPPLGCNFEFFDDFENGLTNWIVTNDGGTCVWDLHNEYEYQMGSTNASGFVIAADADECGSGTTTLTSITLNFPIDERFYPIRIQFDNDWRALDSADAAYIEVSTNGGVTWEIVWSKVGIDWRDTHEDFIIYYYDETIIRFRSVQPGWDWWWAIDNVYIERYCPLTTFYPPHNLILNTVIEPTPRVELSWSRGQFADAFLVYRKIGLPTDPTSYSYMGSTNPDITNYTDTTVDKNHIYTYRVAHMNQGRSNEATAYVPDIITSVKIKNVLPTEFLLEQNYPNPFNPTTIIKYQIPALSFVTLKVYDVLGNEIATLVNEEKPSGKYEVKFDATGLPSGVYFYKLQAGTFVKTKKMVLLK
jgi:hypothetical protein